jgi:hypothetical protein
MTQVTAQPDPIVNIQPLIAADIAPAVPETFRYYVAEDGDERGIVTAASTFLSIIEADSSGVVVIE